jgi:hypothetical protein
VTPERSIFEQQELVRFWREFREAVADEQAAKERAREEQERAVQQRWAAP